jgi:CheY-like chemotaxis protein
VVRESALPEVAGKFTILLADDETAIRQSIAEYLRSAGHQVLDSHASLEALEIARRYKGPLDILLTDVVMPGLRGTELARQVAELHAGIHVIYLSGYPPGFLDSPIPAEANFLQKPFRFASLGEQLKLVPRKV